MHVECRRCIERQLVAQMFRHHRIAAPAALEGEVLIGLDACAADPQRGEAALRMAGHADAACVDQLAPERVVEKKVDGEGDVARTLPELVCEIRNRRVVGVGAVMIERGHDVAARREKLAEPGVVEAVAAASVGEHDERTLDAVERRLGILVKIEIGEERHDEASGGRAADRGVEHRQRQMPAALVRIDVFELSHADGEGGGVGGLRQRRGGRRREQRREQRCVPCGSRSSSHEHERFPDEARLVIVAHVAVLPCT